VKLSTATAGEGKEKSKSTSGHNPPALDQSARGLDMSPNPNAPIRYRDESRAMNSTLSGIINKIPITVAARANLRPASVGWL